MTTFASSSASSSAFSGSASTSPSDGAVLDAAALAKLTDGRTVAGADDLGEDGAGNVALVATGGVFA
jgi:hypothetical protein